MEAQQFISNFRKSTGRLPSQIEVSKHLNIGPQAAIRALMTAARQKSEETPHEPEKAPPEWSHSPVVPLIIAGLLLIAVLTFILSVYFTALWFRTMFSLFIAGAISISMVSYMVLSPQAALYVKGIITIPLWATFIIAIIFSMGSTVAGQYNKITSNVNVEAVNDKALMDSYEAEIVDLTESIKADRAQKSIHEATMERLSQEDREGNAGMIRTERSRVDSLNSTIGTKENRISELRDLQRAEISDGTVGTVEERADFYSFMAGIFKTDKTSMEFIISVFPAIFIDIIAALSLNLALTLLRRLKDD